MPRVPTTTVVAKRSVKQRTGFFACFSREAQKVGILADISCRRAPPLLLRLDSGDNAPLHHAGKRLAHKSRIAQQAATRQKFGARKSRVGKGSEQLLKFGE